MWSFFLDPAHLQQRNAGVSEVFLLGNDLKEILFCSKPSGFLNITLNIQLDYLINLHLEVGENTFFVDFGVLLS